ncbi:MAG: hypothetical protein PVI90_09630 [Desulfobacteraceae bacterium]|jgi:TusA-related sulfurtransferase
MKTFNLRHSIIPFSLLQISNCFQKLKPGEVIEIIGCEESVAQDLKCIIADAEYETIPIKTAWDTPELIIRITKKK